MAREVRLTPYPSQMIKNYLLCWPIFEILDAPMHVYHTCIAFFTVLWTHISPPNLTFYYYRFAFSHLNKSSGTRGALKVFPYKLRRYEYKNDFDY